MWDERVNTAIDEVAREMTDEAAATDDAAFRRRVLARIASDDEPRASWRAAFVLSPIAVAAAIVIAVFIVGRPDPVRPGVSQPAGNTIRPFDGAQGRPEALEGRRTPDTAEARRPGPFGPGDSRPAPQLDPIEVDSIAPAPLVVGTLAPDPIQIERLDAVAPIDVAPLEIITDLQRRQE